MIPFPRRRLVTYHGVLAPASSWRDEVVPDPPSASRRRACPSSSTSPSPVPDGVALDRRYRWAELMKRTFEVDVVVCECGAEREVLSCITDRTVARRILRHLGLPDQPPVPAPSRAPPGLDFGA